MTHVIERQGRVFVALRMDGTRGVAVRPVYHAVTPYCRIALCSQEPGSRSGWAEPPAREVTCPACLKRLSKL